MMTKQQLKTNFKGPSGGTVKVPERTVTGPSCFSFLESEISKRDPWAGGVYPLGPQVVTQWPQPSLQTFRRNKAANPDDEVHHGPPFAISAKSVRLKSGIGPVSQQNRLGLFLTILGTEKTYLGLPLKKT